MKVKQRFILLLSCVGILLGSYAFVLQRTETTWQLVGEYTQVEAGKIAMKFEGGTATNVSLLLQNTYGTTLLTPDILEEGISFNFPKPFAEKSGIVLWNLVEEGKTIANGKFEIHPKATTSPHLETYFGPQSIIAGTTDFSMLVVVPTDAFDNPLPAHTPLKFKKHFQEQLDTTIVYTENLLAWKNMMSEPKAGTMYVASVCANTDSEEFTSDIFPDNAVDFQLNYTQDNAFADGNQLTTFTTATIKDQYGNTVADGTFVTFVAHTETGGVLKTNGSTIHGVAQAAIIHPDHAAKWTVKAYIQGVAESNSIPLTYKAVLDSFPVEFSKDNRKLTVGPLLSYMNQKIPDGAKVKLRIFHKEKLVNTMEATTTKGLAVFRLPKEFYTAKSYHFTITALGATVATDTKYYE